MISRKTENGLSLLPLCTRAANMIGHLAWIIGYRTLKRWHFIILMRSSDNQWIYVWPLRTRRHKHALIGKKEEKTVHSARTHRHTHWKKWTIQKTRHRDSEWFSPLVTRDFAVGLDRRVKSSYHMNIFYLNKKQTRKNEGKKTRMKENCIAGSNIAKHVKGASKYVWQIKEKHIHTYCSDSLYRTS